MTGSQRDAGLVRAVGPWSLAAGLISIIVGAGIFAVPGDLAACIGAYAPLAFLVCGVAIGAVALCFAEGGSRIPTSGGIYGYVEAAFGPFTGYSTGMLLWLSNVLAGSGVAAVLADVVVSLLPQPFKATAHAAVIVVVIGGVTLVNIAGVREGARLINLATVMKLIPLVVFVAAGVWAIHSANFAQRQAPSTQGLGRALILALFATTGMEAGLAASGEVSQPARNIPRALAIAIGSAVLLYIAIQIVAQGILGASLANSTVPLADAMARISPELRVLLLAGTGISMFGCISGFILANPRMLFAFARDGLLPRVLGRVHPRSHVPHIAILVTALLMIVLALTGSFAELAVLSTLAVAPVYIAGCAAAWKLKRKGVAQAGEPLNFRWLGTAAVVGIAGMAGMVALASRTEILGLFVVTGSLAILCLAQIRYRDRKNAAETPAHS